MSKKQKLAAKIMAWVLAALMVVGLAVTSIMMIVSNVRAKKAEKEKEEAAAAQTSELPYYFASL